METVPSIYAPGFLTVWSEGGERQEKPYKRVAKQQTLLNGTWYLRNGNLRKERVVVCLKIFFSRCMPLEGKYILPNIIRQIWMIPASLNEFLYHTEYNNSLGPPPSHMIHQSCKLFKICDSWKILFWGNMCRSQNVKPMNAELLCLRSKGGWGREVWGKTKKLLEISEYRSYKHLLMKSSFWILVTVSHNWKIFSVLPQKRDAPILAQAPTGQYLHNDDRLLTVS